MVLLGKILALLGHNEKSSNFALFSKVSGKFCSLLSFFRVLFFCAFFSSKETKKRRRWSRKNSVLFLDTSHEREKEEKIILTTTKEEALSKRIKSLLLLERTLCALE